MQRLVVTEAAFARRGFQLALLAVAMAAGGYARTAVGPLQEAMRLSLGLSDNQMALLQGPAMALPLLVLGVPLGLAIDRGSRVPLIIGFSALNLLGSVGTAFASDFGLLVLARCVVGLAAFAVVPVVLSLLADYYQPAQRGRATTVVSLGQIAGNSTAFGLGGVLLATSGMGTEGWRSAMLWLSVPLALAALLVLTMREPPRGDVMIARPSTRQTFAELWRYRATIGPIFVGFSFVEVTVGAVLIWAAPTLARNFDLGPDRVGSIMSASMLASGVLGAVAGGVLADVCQRTGGPRRTIFVLGVMALAGAPAALFAVVPGVELASVLLATLMVMLLATAVMAMTLLTVAIPNELRGLCTTASAALNIFFAIAVAPLLVSLLSSAIGGSAMLGRALAIVCIFSSLAAAAAFAYGSKSLPRAATSIHERRSET